MHRLDTTKFFGVTHGASGELEARPPKAVKVSIGLSKGRDLHVAIAGGKWYVISGNDKKQFATKEEAKAAYKQAHAKAGERRYPKKLPYFTFTSLASSGEHEPDFDLIELFGSCPTELDIVFFNSARHYNFDRGMKMYSKSRLLCYGNGLDALRHIDLARTPEERASAAGEKYFPILGGCFSKGCPYAKSENDKPPACKPHGTLRFQLQKALRLGGDCYLTTTGLRSISNLEATLDQLYAFAGDNITGIPLRMELRPYNTPKGTSYSIAITMTADSQAALVRKLHEGPQSLKQIAPPPPISEETMAREFHAEYVPGEIEDAEFEEAPPAAGGRLTLDSLEQGQRDAVLQAGRKKGMNRAKIDAFLGAFEGTVEQAIAELNK